MRPSPQCFRRGFVGRSLDEFKRVSKFALNLEGLSTPRKPFPLVYFNNAESIQDCKKMGDSDIGGFSTVNFDYHPSTDKEPSHARFHGNISTKLPENDPRVQRSGYAGWRTLDRGYTIFGKSLWDMDAYNYLAIMFKSDGRKYFVNIQTESIVPTDIHQHRLYSKSPGEWELVLLRWGEFIRTNHGQIVEPQREMMTQKMRSVGMSLIDRIPGPFDLSIAKVWATNATSDDDNMANFKGHISGGPVPRSTLTDFDKPKPARKEKPEEILI